MKSVIFYTLRHLLVTLTVLGKTPTIHSIANRMAPADSWNIPGHGEFTIIEALY